MKLIVGLGNPGKKYEKTRHNLGFMVVDELARKWTEGEVKWKEDKTFGSLLTKIPNQYARAHQIGNFNNEVILVKPQTFMNASGFAVKALISNFQSPISNLWVIHDDVDLPLGKIKIRQGGAAAGHHGVESIIEKLETDQFLRFRLGIGHPGRGADAQVESYVLKEFDNNEKSEVRHLLKQMVLAVKVALNDGVEKAMTEFNR